MKEEKKFKLDELPDKGSTPEPEVKIKPIQASKPEPRVEKLKSLGQEDRLKTLTTRWHFDKPKRKWGWLIFLIVLFALEKGRHLGSYKKDRERIAKETDGMSELLFSGDESDFLWRHPLYAAFLIPFLFKFKKSSDVYFDITFEGIIAVKKIHVPSHQSPVRALVKWEEIESVRKALSQKRDILIISGKEGDIVELIWDIEEVKKKVIKQVVKGLVSNKNAFRIFIEKEVA